MLNQQQQTQDAPSGFTTSYVSEQTGLAQADASCIVEEHAFVPEVLPHTQNALSALNDREQETVDVARLRRRLPRRSFLRHAGIGWNAARSGEARQTEPLTDVKFAALLNKLRDPDPAAWRERTLCAWLLGHSPLTPEQTAQTANALADVVQKRHATRRQRFRANMHHIARKAAPFAAVYASLLAVQMVLVAIQNNPQAYNLADVPWNQGVGNLAELSLGIMMGFCAASAVLTGALTGLLFPFLTALNAERSNQARAMAALSLGRMQAVTRVEDLCRAALDPSASVRGAAECALLVCLPALTPSHYGQTRADTTILLCHLLNHKKERLFANHHSTERLVLAVLDALGKVGSGDATAHVARVAQDGWTDAVRERARSVLPALEERRRQASDPHLLLRASALPRSDGSQLVRPVLSSPADAPEQLLRASISS